MYQLELNDDDIGTIHFVGNRYCWSDALMSICHEGINEIPEHKAWKLSEAFEKDTEGNHSMFPMLDPHSNLARKLYAFFDSIV